MLCKAPVYRETVGGLAPCGQCLPCRFNDRRKKTARILLEAKCHEHILFVTLTYNEESLPRVLYCPKMGVIEHDHPAGNLDYRAHELFIKRLRRCFPPQTIRFAGVAEYGEKTGRPHYHYIFFGLPYDRRHHLYDCWSNPRTLQPYCDTDRLDIQIPRDEMHVAQYVSGYVVKRLKADDPRLEGRPPEKRLASKGIGLPYLERLLFGYKSPSAAAYILREQDIPRQFTYAGKNWPIDRYLKEKIIHALGIQDSIKTSTQAAFAREMQDLQDRAKNSQDPVIRSWLESTDEKRQRWALERQYQLENAQAVATFEVKSALFDRSKSL